MPRSRNKHHALLLITVLAFSLSTLVGLARLLYETREDQGQVKELLYWSAAQIEREYWRLLDVADRYVHGEDAVGRDQLILQLDLLWSRIGVFDGGEVGHRLGAVEGAADTLEQLSATLEAIEPEVQSLKPGDTAALSDIRDRMRPLSTTIFQLAQRTNISEQARATNYRLRTANTYLVLIALLLGVLATGAVLILFLIKEVRRANHLLAAANAAEARTQSSETRFRDFANASSDWFWEMDETLRFSYFSERFTEITSIPQDVLLGRTQRENAPVNVDPEAWERHLSGLEAHRPFRNFVYSHAKPDGETVYLSLSGQPIFGEDGEFRGHRGTGTDITERKRAENALREAHDTLERRVRERTAALEREVLERERAETELEERVTELENAKKAIEEQADEVNVLAENLALARDQAEAANRAKSEFLATMSHELRTPLNAIIGFSEIIACESFGPVGSVKYRGYADDIHFSGQHLLELINDILDLSKVESGMDELIEENIEISAIAESVFRLVKQRAEKNQVKLEMVLPKDPPLLFADDRKLKQILVNVLSNAIKFTEAGGRVVMKIECCDQEGYVFRVIDTGIGIAAEDIPKALSQFGQVDSALNRQFDGTGLGLPLSKSLVELHGGSLDLQSEVGVGTTVTARFPAERIVAAEARPSSHSAA